MMIGAAQADSGRFDVLPVFIDLASWRPGEEFKAWLIKRMSKEYGTDEAILEKWLLEGSIALILDNVSWLPREAIASSLEEIMRFRREFPGVDVLITGNEDVIGSHLARLQLRIIRINELDKENVRSFLAGFQKSHAQLVDAVNADDRLASLLRSRLLMTSALLAFRESALPTARPVDSDILMRGLIEYLMSRQDRNPPAALDLDLTEEADRKIAINYLAWLAAKLAPGESVFFNWLLVHDLPEARSRKLAQAISAATISALTGLWFFSMFGLLTSVWIASAVGGLVFTIMILFNWLDIRGPRKFGSDSPLLGLSMGNSFSGRRLLDQVKKHKALAILAASSLVFGLGRAIYYWDIMDPRARPTVLGALLLLATVLGCLAFIVGRGTLEEGTNWTNVQAAFSDRGGNISRFLHIERYTAAFSLAVGLFVAPFLLLSAVVIHVVEGGFRLRTPVVNLLYGVALYAEQRWKRLPGMEGYGEFRGAITLSITVALVSFTILTLHLAVVFVNFKLLNIWLVRKGVIPRRSTDLLTHLVQLSVMSQYGAGQYSFSHQLILEYFRGISSSAGAEASASVASDASKTPFPMSVANPGGATPG
jgi:hypothetical protein